MLLAYIRIRTPSLVMKVAHTIYEPDLSIIELAPEYGLEIITRVWL
jgi:hypothetical protein